MCRGELFSGEAFKIPLSSPPEEGDVADWVRDTSLLYEGDLNAKERMEYLVQDLQRVGSVPSERPTATTAEIVQGFLNGYDDMIQRQESRLAGLLSRERLAQDGGETLNSTDRVELDELGRDLQQLHEGSRGLHNMVQRLLTERPQASGQTATVNDGLSR